MRGAHRLKFEYSWFHTRAGPEKKTIPSRQGLQKIIRLVDGFGHIPDKAFHLDFNIIHLFLECSDRLGVEVVLP